MDNVPSVDFAVPLREADADADPLRQFTGWFADAAAAGIREPEAAALASANAAAVPSVRIVLVKRTDAEGFQFFTSYAGRKGRELTENPRAALLFYWDKIGRQVRLEGPVTRLAPEDSAAYIRTRARASRLSALASPQSEVVFGREELEARAAELAVRYERRELPIPEDWGGFRLVPERYEFWQHRSDRLHDRLLYTPRATGEGWEIRRLAP